VHDLMRRFLTPHGFCVVSEKRGDTGLERAHKLRPDVIVLDVMMPGRDGWSVLSQLKSDEELESIPVVMVTMVDDEEIGYALGASEYLVKPIDRERLVRVLSRFRSGADATALVVEDENAIRELMAHNLRKAGWQVETAADGREALDRLERMLPDVIVLDLMMPRMDGFEVAEALRHDVRLRDIPIVVVTAMDLDEAEKRRLEETVERILSKDATSTDQLLAEVLEASGMSVQSVEEDTSRSTGGSRTSIAESVHLNP
ncbi:MAG: response regulator, partial [Persicimonas sp.]